MNIRLTRPPQQNASNLEWQQWWERLWRVVLPAVSTSGDADDTIPAGSTYHGVTALSAGRTLTLPLTAGVVDGQELVIQDESNMAAAFTVTLLAAGTDTLAGPATITTNGGRRRLFKRETTWYSA